MHERPSTPGNMAEPFVIRLRVEGDDGATGWLLTGYLFDG